MNRRRFLLVAGIAVGLAGCLGEPDSAGIDTTSSPTETTPDMSPTTASPTDSTGSAAIDVIDAAVQPGVVALTTPDSIGVFDDAGQYLLVRVDSGDGMPPTASEFEFELDGDVYRTADFHAPLSRDGELGVGYTTEDGAGWLVFELPETTAASDVQLRWPDGQWTPPDTVRERLSAPLPTFDVQFSVPASVSRGETPTLSLTVTNTSDVPGRVVVVLNRVGPDVAYIPVRDVLWDLEPGETRSEQWDGESPTGDRGVTYHLGGANVDRRSWTIQLHDGDNTTSA